VYVEYQLRGAILAAWGGGIRSGEQRSLPITWFLSPPPNIMEGKNENKLRVKKLLCQSGRRG
jgi:hypothetical protein